MAQECEVVKTKAVPTAYIPSESDWKFMVQWGNQAIRSGMLPTAIKTGEGAAIVVLKGRELGLSFMTSVAHIHIVNGKPTMSAELIQGMARRNLPGLTINILESNIDEAKIEFIRPEKGSKPFVQSFTMKEAIAAKLTSKEVWKSYPAAMLWSRAVTAGLRKVCPEALMGISYTLEELDHEIDESGNVIETNEKANKAEEWKARQAQLEHIMQQKKRIWSLWNELGNQDGNALKAEFFEKFGITSDKAELEELKQFAQELDSRLSAQNQDFMEDEEVSKGIENTHYAKPMELPLDYGTAIASGNQVWAQATATNLKMD